MNAFNNMNLNLYNYTVRNREPFINGDLTKEPCYTIIRIKAKLLGADENLAEFQARQIEQAIEVATSKI